MVSSLGLDAKRRTPVSFEQLQEYKQDSINPMS